MNENLKNASPLPNFWDASISAVNRQLHDGKIRVSGKALSVVNDLLLILLKRLVLTFCTSSLKSFDEVGKNDLSANIYIYETPLPPDAHKEMSPTNLWSQLWDGKEDIVASKTASVVMIDDSNNNAEVFSRTMNSKVPLWLKVKSIVDNRNGKINVVSTSRVLEAVNIIFPGQLGKFAITEQSKAMTKFSEAIRNAPRRFDEDARHPDPMADKAGLIFPPELIAYLVNHQYGLIASEGAAIALAAILEYMCTEIVSISSYESSQGIIMPRHIRLFFKSDRDFAIIFPEIIEVIKECGLRAPPEDTSVSVKYDYKSIYFDNNDAYDNYEIDNEGMEIKEEVLYWQCYNCNNISPSWSNKRNLSCTACESPVNFERNQNMRALILSARNSAFKDAVNSGQLEAVKECLNNGVDLNDDQFVREESFFPGRDVKITPLYKACERRHKGVVELLLNQGAIVDKKDQDPYGGYTPLLMACEKGYKDIVTLLLDHGASVNARSSYTGYTPGHLACYGGYKDIVSILLNGGADPNAQGLDGRTPLHLTCSTGQKDLMFMLLLHGADTCVETTHYQTPMQIAHKRGKVDIVTFLQDWPGMMIIIVLQELGVFNQLGASIDFTSFSVANTEELVFSVNQ